MPIVPAKTPTDFPNGGPLAQELEPGFVEPMESEPDGGAKLGLDAARRRDFRVRCGRRATRRRGLRSRAQSRRRTPPKQPNDSPK